ncbi:MAG: hypothetical protein ACTSSJ_03255 [Candidatus Odinarchaeia archaeon]
MGVKKSLDDIIRILLVNGMTSQEIKESLVELGFPESKVSAKIEKMGLEQIGQINRSNNTELKINELYAKFKEMRGEVTNLKLATSKITLLEKKINLLIELIGEYVPELIERIKSKK